MEDEQSWHQQEWVGWGGVLKGGSSSRFVPMDTPKGEPWWESNIVSNVK